MKNCEQAIGVSFTYYDEDEYWALHQEWLSTDDWSDYYMWFNEARRDHEIIEDTHFFTRQIIRSSCTDEQAAQELLMIAPLTDDGGEYSEEIYQRDFEYYGDKYERYQWEKKVFPC